jgi:acetyl-CoA acetyltransferase
MGKHAAAIFGFSEWAPRKIWSPPLFALEAQAQLAAETLEDAGFEKYEVDGLAIAAIPEAPLFAPSAVAEYLGIPSNFNEIVDLGGATAAGMVWRSAAAIEAGVCDVVLCLCPAVPAPPAPGSTSIESRRRKIPIYMGGETWGSPQALYEIPAGLVAAAPSYALIAKRYMAEFGLDEPTLAKLSVHARYNAQANPAALFCGKPITLDDVMASRMLVDPIKLLEAVMPCYGGAAVLVARADRARRGRRRPVRISGYGERLSHRSVTYMPNLLNPPLRLASERAYRMAGVIPQSVDLASVYDCFTITVLITLESAGFCERGAGAAFVKEHDFRFDGGDFPLNTHGGQLGFGQPGLAGGMSHVVEAVRQLQGRAAARQLPNCNIVYCNGNGGMMSEHVALILEGG